MDGAVRDSQRRNSRRWLQRRPAALDRRFPERLGFAPGGGALKAAKGFPRERTSQLCRSSSAGAYHRPGTAFRVIAFGEKITDGCPFRFPAESATVRDAFTAPNFAEDAQGPI